MNLIEFENLSNKISEIISKIHSLNMENIIELNQDHLKNVLNNLYAAYVKNTSNFDEIEFEDENLKENFRKLSKFNYKKMVNWALAIEQKIKSKLVFSHNDINR